MRRLQSAVHNAREIAAFGRLGDNAGSPYEQIYARTHHRLRRYESAVRRTAGTPASRR